MLKAPPSLQPWCAKANLAGGHLPPMLRMLLRKVRWVSTCSSTHKEMNMSVTSIKPAEASASVGAMQAALQACALQAAQPRQRNLPTRHASPVGITVVCVSQLGSWVLTS